MSSSLRVKIEFNYKNQKNNTPLKFMYLIHSPATTTIEKLISILQQYIIDQFIYENIHIVNLLTEDGYLLMKNDLCSDILNRNEKLICVDMYRFVVENSNTIDMDKAWLKLEHHDTTDDIQKYLCVGLNDVGKFYIYLWGGRLKKELYLFNTIELLALVHKKQKDVSLSVMRVSETSPFEWFIEAIFEQDFTTDNTLILKGNLRAGDMTQIKTGTLRISLNKNTKTIEHWEVTHLSIESDDLSHTTEQELSRLNQLKDLVSPPKRTGPTIDTTVLPTKIDTYECDGDSVLRIVQGNASVEMAQDTHARDSNFRNFITITNLIISKKPVVLPEILNHKRSTPAEKPISIVRVNVQYQKSDGKWIDCQNSKIIVTSAQSNEKQRQGSAILNIEPDKIVSVSIETAILVKGKPNRSNDTRNRAHRSLPQPLKLKIILTDNLTKTCSLIIEQINEPLQLITKEIFGMKWKNEMKKLIAFIYADDCEYDERIYIGIYLSNNDLLVVDDGSKRIWMQKSQMRTMQWNAKKNKITEESASFLGDSQTKIIWLFDSETYLFYALRVELTTTTSQTIETVLLPLDEMD
ncbi:hypothetical protein I4U23_020073 [Adineta vaga]|nr:hypothetical protein I4U23_020073 [Adineta vaga]